MLPTAPVPPPGRPGVTFAEIAAHYGKAARYVAENPRWGRHPDWPVPVARRGRSNEYDPQQVATFIRAHHTRPTADLETARTYTVPEIAAATGLAPDTVYADITRGRWPEPDRVTAEGTKLWAGATVTRHLAGRRTYRRTPRPPQEQ